MDKYRLVTEIVAKTGIPRNHAKKSVDAIIQIISDAMVSGERVTLSGLGTFSVKSRSQRIGRNPHTNEPVHIPARPVPNFRPDRSLRKLVEGDSSDSDSLQLSPLK